MTRRAPDQLRAEAAQADREALEASRELQRLANQRGAYRQRASARQKLLARIRRQATLRRLADERDGDE